METSYSGLPEAQSQRVLGNFGNLRTKGVFQSS